MRADFKVTASPTNRCVSLALLGFFKPTDVDALRAAIRREYARLRCGPNEHRTLLDLREMEIQSQDTLVYFAELLNDPTYQGERLAIVYSHTLVRMQIGRVASDREHTRYFDDVDAAKSWLAERKSLAA